MTRARRIASGLVWAAALLAPAAGRAQSLVVVRNEAGALVSGAEVYRNCTLQGVTGGGQLLVPMLSVGDHLQVRKLVRSYANRRAAHDGWTFHAWRTNIEMANDGSQVDFTVSDPAAVQNVVIRSENTQIGWNMVGSVEYNATPANLDEISRALQSASTYLFDVTDGQFFLEQVTLYEDRQYWSDADYQFFAHMSPSGDFGNYVTMDSRGWHMYLPGPGYDGVRGRYLPGTWPTAAGFRTLGHVHGHYGLALLDENVQRDGVPSTCTLDRGSVTEERRATIMDTWIDASELCHNGNHNPLADQFFGRSSWAQVDSAWSGSSGAFPWTLRTPMTRGAVNPGPTTLSCFSRMTPHIVPAPVEACGPVRLVARNTSGEPVRGVSVDLVHGGRRIYQGETDASGGIALHGAVAGDGAFLRPTASQQGCLWMNGSATVGSSCGRVDVTSDLQCFYIPVDRPFPIIRFIHQGDPAPDVYISLPASDPGAFVRLVLEQDGLRRQEVPLAYDQKLKAFTGSFAVDTESGLNFALELTTAGPKGEKIETAARMRGARSGDQGLMAAGGPLFGADADVDVRLDAGALPEGTGVLVSETVFAPAAPAGLAAGATVVTVAGERPLAKAATLSLRYDGKPLVPGTAQIYRLDGATWVVLSTRADDQGGRASADIDAWGTFAVFGQPQL